MVTLQALRTQAARQLADTGIENPLLDVDLMLERVLHQTRAWIITHNNSPVSENQIEQFNAMLARRVAHEPMAYILGEREFYGSTFAVGEGVLIPRPDTETLIEAVKSVIPDYTTVTKFAEVGVGSGIIAVTLLQHFPMAEAVGTDVSPEALAMAWQNAERHAVQSRLALQETSLLDGVKGPFDLVVSNPPYIPTADIAALDKTVQLFEPHLALDGGADGLVLYRALVPQAYAVLADGGWCVLEHGYNQADDIAAIFAAAGFKGVVSFKDLGGHVRVTAGKKEK